MIQIDQIYTILKRTRKTLRHPWFGCAVFLCIELASAGYDLLQVRSILHLPRSPNFTAPERASALQYGISLS